MQNMQDIKNVKGRIHSTETFGAVDGPGIRFIVFFQGCPLRCAYCHNPDSWEFSSGKEVTAGEIMETILKYKNYVKGGVTFSGGECLAQPDFCNALIKLCKANDMHVALDTSGIMPLSVTKECIDNADLILLDIKELKDEDCISLTSKSNKNTFELLEYCQSTNKKVWIRHVCLPGYTLVPEKLEALADFVKGYSCVERVELNAFHQMGMYKWEELGIDYSLKDAEAPLPEEMDNAKAIFKARGLNV